MKVLVLGPNGQLGSDIFRVHQESRKNSLELIPIDRKKLDVSETEKIYPFLKEIDFQVLINCTSYHKTDEVELNGTQAFKINAHAVQAMAQACEAKKARFIHISTDYVFSGEKREPYTEEDPIGPINVYGASKAMGEKLALMTHENTLILRVASLFGIAGSSGKGTNFVETMIRIGREKGEIKVVDDITMSPTGTEDVARWILKLIEKEIPPGIYHAVNSGAATWYEFAKEIISMAKIKATVTPLTQEQFPTLAKRPSYSALDNEKISKFTELICDWKMALNQYLKEKGYLN